MFFAQVPHTTISCTWIIIWTTSLLISITNIVFLFFVMMEVFLFYYFVYIGSTIRFSPFNWVVCFLNTFFSFDQSVRGILYFILARNMLFIWLFTRYTCSMSRNTRKTWIVFSNINSFGLFYFGTFIRKLADGIDLDLFSVFTVSSVSILWVDLYLFNDFDLSNDILVWFISDGSIFFTFRFLWFVCFVECVNFIFAMGGVMDFFTTLGFVSVSLIPSLTIFYVLVNNGFLEDMILVLVLLYPVLLQIQSNFNGGF